MDCLPPDPYLALGVSKDATAAEIKAQYRKLVLKIHPDKIQDEALKAAAADDFHKVQSAYEIVSDDRRRERYDNQRRLEDLRREVSMMQRPGGLTRAHTDGWATGFKEAPFASRGGDFETRRPERSGRMSPQYEERRPSYPDYDEPRPTSRKTGTFDRTSKRGAPPREESKRSKAPSKKSKENERASREEKSRKQDRDTRRDREMKDGERRYNAYVSDESPTGEFDANERAWRQRPEDEQRYARAAAEEESRRRQEEAAAAQFIGAERAHKIYTQDFNAREYIARGATTPQSPVERPNPVERRPSPVRKASSREKVEYIKRDSGPPVMIRRGSGKPDIPRKASSREKDLNIAEEPQELPRKPALNKMQSSPAEIRPPYERQRSSSLQIDARDLPVPGIQRAETMPYPQNREGRDSRRKDSSKLRTEVRGGLPTPETSPEPPISRSYSYKRDVADEAEFTVPDSYRTEIREPNSGRKLTRSPSPIREPPMRDYPNTKSRASAKYAPQPPPAKRTTSTSYVYPLPAEVVEPRRPSLPRESSSSTRLFGEVPTTRSPKPNQSKFTLPADDIKYSPKPRAEDIKTATGYKVRRPGGDKNYTSRQTTPVYAR